jgi:hypothetical protein
MHTNNSNNYTSTKQLSEILDAMNEQELRNLLQTCMRIMASGPSKLEKLSNSKVWTKAA